MERKRLDKDAIVADYQAGMTPDQIANKHGCHHTSVRGVLKTRGVYQPGPQRNRRGTLGTIAKANEEVLQGERVPATHTKRMAVSQVVKAETPGPQQVNPQVAETPLTRARCRVAMFEVEGDATAVQHAVDAIKAALESRS